MATRAIELEGLSVTVDPVSRARGELAMASVIDLEAIQNQTATSLAGILSGVRPSLSDQPASSKRDGVGRGPSTLPRHAFAGIPGEYHQVKVDLRLFLGTLVILRAHQLRTSARPWEAVGRRLGFTRTTLHRKSKKWSGSTLKELAETPHGELLARFMSDFEGGTCQRI
ncbi:hypothetical protein [Candidatus Palauibacter sp.]|uniref:hypothetical protein n=1 Tax=Candidatus Palauibacter sp. TaxID=3101350 RepID=UPI003AF2035E